MKLMILICKNFNKGIYIKQSYIHIESCGVSLSPSPLMNKIARLTTSASHHLEAEQVISDLAATVKELVENALDSNPSSISTFKVWNR